MPAPPPLNLAAMAAAWNDPLAFQAQVATYLAQLEREGFRLPVPDITSAIHPAHEKETQ